MANLPKAVAAEIRAEMARQNLSQEALGNVVGIRQDGISRRLRGETEITVAELDRIADALGVPVSQLLRSESPASVTS